MRVIPGRRRVSGVAGLGVTLVWILGSFAWLLVWCGLGDGFVLAQTDSAASVSSAPEAAVEITVVGGPLDLERVRSVIEPRPLGGSRPRWTGVARFNPMEILKTIHDSQITIVRCWVDVSDSTRARLYLAARSGQRFLVRDVELSGIFNEVDRESLSNVLELSITALLDDDKAGLTRAQAEAVLADREQQPARAPVAVRPQPEQPKDVSPTPIATAFDRRSTTERQGGVHVAVGAFYGALAQGGGLPVAHGPGVEIGLGANGGRPIVAAWISGQYRWQERFAGPAAGAELLTIATRGALELGLPIGVYQVGARLGAGLDVVRITPTAGTSDPGAMLTSQRWSKSLVFTAMLAIHRALGRRLLLGAGVFADVLPTVVHYDQTVAGATSEVASPRWLRPGLLVELAVR